MSLAYDSKHVIAKYINAEKLVLAVEDVQYDSQRRALILYDITTASKSKLAGYARYSIAKETLQSSVNVDHIELEEPYQGKKISPILWHHLCAFAQGAYLNQRAEWSKSAKDPDLDIEPIPPLISVGLPNTAMDEYWTKMNFDFRGAQQVIWDRYRASGMDEKGHYPPVPTPDGKTVSRNKPIVLAKIAPPQIYGDPNQVWKVALDGMKKGQWTAVKM